MIFLDLGVIGKPVILLSISICWFQNIYLLFFTFFRVSFNDLPDSAKSASVITELGGTTVADSSELIEVCGSPGEVGNDPSKGHKYFLQKYGDVGQSVSSLFSFFL